MELTWLVYSFFFFLLRHEHFFLELILLFVLLFLIASDWEVGLRVRFGLSLALFGITHISPKAPHSPELLGTFPHTHTNHFYKAINAVYARDVTVGDAREPSPA